MFLCEFFFFDVFSLRFFSPEIFFFRKVFFSFTSSFFLQRDFNMGFSFISFSKVFFFFASGFVFVLSCKKLFFLHVVLTSFCKKFCSSFWKFFFFCKWSCFCFFARLFFVLKCFSCFADA